MEIETAPKTLDLAAQARQAINVLTRAVVPQQSYAVWQCMALHTNPPYFAWPNWLTSKWLEALPRMRRMTGDDRNLDVEAEMMQACLTQIGPDGLLYYPATSPDVPPGTAYPMVCARMILAMAAWHERDGNAEWVERIRAMAGGLAAIAIRRGHYAYYPVESGYAGGTWSYTQRGGGRTEHFPYSPPDEPSREQQGHEGTVKFDVAVPVRALVRAFRITGDEALLDAARRLAAFCLLPSMWEDGAVLGIAGHEHGLFAGHFHGNMMAVRGLLELAIATGDSRLKGLVREAYEHARRAGIARIGWFPAWVQPERFGRPASLHGACETCGIADMIALGVAMSDAGMGDYWDDVDACLRNQLVEQQVTDADRVQAMHGHVKETQPRLTVQSVLGATDDVIERSMGGFGMGTPAALSPAACWGCCTANGSLALYDGWDGIVRFRDGVATVNLLLSRVTPWVDVVSELPFEGRVRLEVKAAQKLAVRVPGWASIDNVTVSLGETAVSPARVGRYLLVEDLKPGDAVELRFPVTEQVDHYAVNGQTWRIAFRGSTAMDVSPREEGTDRYQLYQRGERAGEKMVESAVIAPPA